MLPRPVQVPFLGTPFPPTCGGGTLVVPVVPAAPTTSVALAALPPLPTLLPAAAVAALLFPATPVPAPTPFPAPFAFGFGPLAFLTPSGFLTGLGTAWPVVPPAVPAAVAATFGFETFGFAGLGVDVGCGAGGRADICARVES